MLKLAISDLFVNVVNILQYVVLCYSVVDSNSIACGRKSSVILNLLLDENDTAFFSVTWGLQSKCYFVYNA
jgi:hypothetical protein